MGLCHLPLCDSFDTEEWHSHPCARTHADNRGGVCLYLGGAAAVWDHWGVSNKRGRLVEGLCAAETHPVRTFPLPLPRQLGLLLLVHWKAKWTGNILDESNGRHILLYYFKTNLFM